MEKNAKIYVAGHRGLVGSAIVRELRRKGYANLVLRSHAELDLTRQEHVERFLSTEKPEYVFLAAAKVGGILANSTYPADFIYQNLAIQTHVLQASYAVGVKRLLFLGSSCIYPRDCPQPMREDYLLTGPLELTNEAYATAKIAGIKMCQAYNKQYGTAYLAVMPTNLYGPEDNFNLETSHVLPALLRKFYEAKVTQQPSVTVWGSGAPRREFLHVDDLANASVFLMSLGEEKFRQYATRRVPPIVNVGVGLDITIKELTGLIREVTGFHGDVVWDGTKPDGVMRKLLDCNRLFSAGWTPSIALKIGLESTCEWYLAHRSAEKVK